MATELDELMTFLTAPSPPLRQAAVDIVRGLTGSDDGLASLASRSAALIPALALLLRDAPAVAAPAAEALVNLSQDPAVSREIVGRGVVRVAVEVVFGGDGAVARLVVMLLVNLTQLETGVDALLQVEDEKLEGLYISKLVRSFCRSSDDETSVTIASRKDPFEHVGSILVNISKTKEGRKVLLDPKRSLLKQIIPQFESRNQLRRKGVSGTVRNCCFEAENSIQNLLSLSEFLWPVLLIPVAGNKAYSEHDMSKMPLEIASALGHEREPVDDPELRIQALDSIYLIVLQEDGRKAFWDVNGPRILQVGYEDEVDPQVMEAYERIGSLLVDA